MSLLPGHDADPGGDEHAGADQLGNVAGREGRAGAPGGIGPGDQEGRFTQVIQLVGQVPRARGDVVPVGGARPDRHGDLPVPAGGLRPPAGQVQLLEQEVLKRPVFALAGAQRDPLGVAGDDPERPVALAAYEADPTVLELRLDLRTALESAVATLTAGTLARS